MNMCQWEMIGRGMTTERRAWTLGITFGAGPVLAVVGSSGFATDPGGQFSEHLGHAAGETVELYRAVRATAPAMLAAAICASQATLPPGETGEPRPSLAGIREGCSNTSRTG
ncbi:MAG: hypothetical protein U0992_13145 [Planctomycetaceae bacterium]